ncbi:undecaprenyldiphospho-muramoylpentapeptide beta-N-acetylglucosaminyltransferase [Symmachiella dynata]|uniref:undecaprenyldiphospho-muramoylpentapeptide beta-N-acetylglucosaminyltransferase n=1 Tax=Symmachiella dynata TaxID=2527995 RepID=UPI0030EBF638
MSAQSPNAPPIFCFAGGGTGGHLIPGLNVARELQQRYPQAVMQFLGSGRPQEEGLVASAGFKHYALSSESLTTARRRPWQFLWRNWRAVRQAQKLFRNQKPTAVIGLGGFASVPPVVAARRMGIPTVLLEQNIIPGRATRWLCRRAGAVCVSYAASAEHLPAGVNVEQTGNPVHPDIAALVASSHTDQRRILLILGGSQGASAVNRAVTMAADILQDQLTGWTIVHQTGINDWRDVEHEYQRLGLEHTTSPFFSDMPQRYAEAGLAVSRAGATTLAELACAGCPTITIPYPHAADDHQRLNAREFVTAGAAEIVEQQTATDQTAELLAKQISRLLADDARRLEMRHAMHSLARPLAARDVADIICRTVDGSLMR